MHKLRILILTSVWKELCVNVFEGVFTHNPFRALLQQNKTLLKNNSNK